MKDISLKQRLIIPIALLGMVALLTNIRSLINLHNVNANAAQNADNNLDGQSRQAKSNGWCAAWIHGPVPLRSWAKRR